MNPNITVEFIKENPNGIPASSGVAGGKSWNMHGLSGNPNHHCRIYKRKSKWGGRKTLEYVLFKLESKYHFRIYKRKSKWGLRRA